MLISNYYYHGLLAFSYGLEFFFPVLYPPLNINQVQGVVQDGNGKTVATLFGKWDESIHYVSGDCSCKGKGFESLSESHLLWKRSKPPKFSTRYNLTRFAITLNELTHGLKVLF